MKKIFVVLLFCMSLSAFAQTLKIDFETNDLGWNEYSGKRGEAIIKDGVLHISSQKAGLMSATTYLPIDPQKNFELRAKFLNTKLNDDERGIAVILNYKDDYNLDYFYITNETAVYNRIIDNEVVGFRYAQVKMDKKLKDHDLTVKSTFGKLEFIVDAMKCLEVRCAPLQYTGFGLGVYSGDGNQVADIDELVIIQ